ncbi:MAG: GNAT family N-acetyltransferase [Crocinitomicaceae bacterium]|nr:GNAT family N-acetyltransferase [Crocinitomicaceae bacterium]
MELTWEIKHFDELSTKELYELLQLRSDVFVVEQNCVYQDIDDKDLVAHHVIGRLSNSGEIVAYARLLPSSISYKEPSIGRVLTSNKYRKHGFGKALMQHSIENCLRLFSSNTIRISAQTYLLKFYTELGFIIVGEPYDEDGIPHIEMVLVK